MTPDPDFLTDSQNKLMLKVFIQRAQIVSAIVFFGLFLMPVQAKSGDQILRKAESRSECELRQEILKKVPLGTGVGKVRDFIANQGWKEVYNLTGPQNHLSETFFPGVKGSCVIGVDMGRRRVMIVFEYHYDAYFGFDSSGKLIDLKVRKIANGP